MRARVRQAPCPRGGIAPVAVMSDALLDGRVRKFEAIMLPLASGGRTVDKVPVGQVWV